MDSLSDTAEFSIDDVNKVLIASLNDEIDKQKRPNAHYLRKIQENNPPVFEEFEKGLTPRLRAKLRQVLLYD